MKKNILLIFLTLLFFTDVILAQSGNRIYNEILKTKDKGIKFRISDDIFLKTNDKAIDNEFIDPSEVYIFNYNFESIRRMYNSENISIRLDLGNEEIVMDLIEIFGLNDFITQTSDGRIENNSNNMKAKHYRGIIRNDPYSLVAISFFEDDVMGIVSNRTGNFNFEKSRIGNNQYVFYKDTNLKNKKEFVCETNVDPSNYKEYDPEVLFSKELATRSLNEACVKIYFETEYDIFQSLGSVSAVENYIVGMFNQVALLFFNEGINTTIDYLAIWNQPDPYTASNTAGLLSQFRTHNTMPASSNAGQLLTFRNVGGGRAG